MLDVLWMAMQEMPTLLKEDNWQSLDIDYHPPRVERVWRQWGPYRILLHVVHPCDSGEALMHPHPWPSAVRILGGRYVMQMGQGDTLPGAPAVTIELSTGSAYEMIDPHGWHSVRPFGEKVMSIMVTGPPWGQRTLVGGDSKHRLAPTVRPKAALKSLSPERVEEILVFFRLARWPRTPPTHQTQD